MDLSLGLESTHVLITGGAGLIGAAVVEAFLAAGARVSSLDIAHPDDPAVTRSGSHLLKARADITSETSFTHAWSAAVEAFGPVSCCVALASLDLSVLPHVASAADMELAQFRRTLDVNVGGTFLAARTWLRGLRSVGENEEEGNGRDGRARERLRNVGLIIVGSESGWFGERSNPDYASSKSAVQVGLLQSLKADVPMVWEGARVNAVAPGPVETPRFKQECIDNPEQYWLDAQATTALGKPVPMDAVARSILYLASENWSGNVHGQVLNVDSGKQGKVMWTKEEASGRFPVQFWYLVTFLDMTFDATNSITGGIHVAIGPQLKQASTELRVFRKLTKCVEGRLERS